MHIHTDTHIYMAISTHNAHMHKYTVHTYMYTCIIHTDTHVICMTMLFLR